MNKYILFLCLLSGYIVSAQSNCSCNDCPFTIPEQGSASSTFTVNGATSNTLGVNGQRLKAINLEFFHDGIGEISLILEAPNGSQIELINQNSIAQFNRDNQFDICFVDCGEAVNPHPGTSQNFNTADFDVIGENYSGIYYPSNPGTCLSDLTGSVNGTWTLIWDDFIFLMGGTLFNWSLEFENNSGTDCEAVCSLPNCIANGGSLGPIPENYCVGSPDLNLNISIDFSGSSPNETLYGYQFIITDDNGIIIDYLNNADLTGFNPGSYSICGISYLLGEFSQFPVPNGTNTLTDLENVIMSQDLCAEISSNCLLIIIEPEPPAPDVTGPTNVCPNQPVVYTINNFDPESQLIATLSQFSVSQFFINENQVFITFLSGPVEACFTFENDCGTSEPTCLSVTVSGNTDPIEINGPLEVCPNIPYIYEISPAPSMGSSIDIVIEGGTLVSQSNNQFEVIWTDDGGVVPKTATVTLTDSQCGEQSPVIINVNLIEVNAPLLFGDFELCLGSTGTVNTDNNPNATNYSWIGGPGLTILSGQGTNGPIGYSADQAGLYEICLILESVCGELDPVCETITILELPSPTIDEVLPSCNFDFILNAQIGPNSSGFWTQTGGPSAATLFNPNNTQTSAQVMDSGLYSFQFTETNGVCEGSSEIDVAILIPPTVVEDEVICLGSEYQVQISITGVTEPYFIDGTEIIGNVFISSNLPDNSPYSFIVSDVNGCSTIFEGFVSCPCLTDAGTMSGELIEVCISSGGSLVTTFNDDATFDLNDVGAYILHDDPTNILGNIIAINTSGIFDYQPEILPGQVYYISYVVGESVNGNIDLNDPCLSVAIGQPAIFYDDPEVQLFIENITCGYQTELLVNTTGAISEVFWTIISAPLGSTAQINSESANPAVLEVDQPGIYTLQVEISNQTCNTSEEFTIDFQGQPEIDNINIECLSSEFFTATISFGGDAQDLFLTLPGAFEDQLYVSDLLEVDNIYDFEISDSNGCIIQSSIGPIDCDCISSPGSMGEDTLFFCETGGVIVLDFNNDGILGQFDTSLFVIHRLDGNILGDPVFFTDQTTFELPPGLETEVTYFISNIVTSTDPFGEPDLLSSCLRVSEGQPLFVYSIPVIELPADTSICFGPLELSFNNTNDGEWSLISESNPAEFNYLENEEILTISPEAPGVVRLEFIASNGLCTSTDTLNMSFWEPPSFSRTMTECMDNFFITTLEISGGQAPYQLNGSTLPSNEFIADAAPSDSLLIFTVVDANGCSLEISVTQNCDCETTSGALEGDPLFLCEEQDIDLSSFTLSDSIVPDGYELIYLLIREPQLTQNNIIQQNDNSILPWSPLIEVNQTYYIVAVVTTLDGSVPNLDDICISVSNAIPVIWEPIPRVTLEGSIAACLGDEVSVMIESVGNFPFEVTLRNSLGEEQRVLIENSSQILTYTTAVSGIVTWEVSSVESNCAALFSGSSIINVSEPVDIDLSEPIQVCNNPIFGSVLNLTNLIESDQEGIWIYNNSEIINGIIDFEGFEPGFYTLEFSTVGLEAPCPGSIFMLIVEVVECLCPNVVLPGSLELCAADTSILLNETFSIPFEGEWSLVNNGGMEHSPSLSDGLLVINSTTQGEYTLIYSLTGDFPEDCPLDWEMMLQIERPPQSGIPLFDIIICPLNEELITLSNYLIEADDNGIWLLESGQAIDPILAPTQLLTGQNRFVYRVSGEICPNSISEVELFVPEILTFTVISSPPFCPDEDNGRIEINLENANSEAILLLNNTVQSGLTVNNLGPGVYNLQIRDRFGCLYSPDSLEFLTPQPFTLDLGEDLTVNIGEETLITAATNLQMQEITSIRWLNEGFIIEEGTLNLLFTPSMDARLSIELLTLDGCLLTDNINIAVGSPPIYLPTAFYPNSLNLSNRTFGPMTMEGINISIESFQIFDRWGNKVYEVTNLQDAQSNVFWDGTFKGRDAIEGIYIYKLVYSNLADKSILVSGEVLLLK